MLASVLPSSGPVFAEPICFAPGGMREAPLPAGAFPLPAGAAPFFANGLGFLPPAGTAGGTEELVVIAAMVVLSHREEVEEDQPSYHEGGPDGKLQRGADHVWTRSPAPAAKGSTSRFDGATVACASA
jgi:hypothetical protein